jgi:predicted dehydrogenase
MMKGLFCGLGGIGQRHLRILKRLKPDVQIGAVRHGNRTFEIGDDLQADYGTDIVQKYGIEIFNSIEDAVAFNPDFGVVANPTSLHVATALELLESGIPVFVEKPISHNREGISDLIRVSREKNIPVMTGYMMRFHPCALKVKEFIESGDVGKVYSVVLIINSYMPGWHRYEDYNTFYAGMKSLGGGVVLTEIHELDLLNWYFGTPSKLWAMGGRLSNLDIDVEDTVGILMEQPFKGDRFPIQITMSFVQREPYRRMIIFGEKGKIEWNISGSEIIMDNRVENCQQVVRYPEFDRNDMFMEQMKHFIKCVTSGSEPVTSLSNVINGHLTALTIKDALARGQIMEILSLQE